MYVYVCACVRLCAFVTVYMCAGVFACVRASVDICAYVLLFLISICNMYISV